MSTVLGVFLVFYSLVVMSGGRTVGGGGCDREPHH